MTLSPAVPAFLAGARARCRALLRRLGVLPPDTAGLFDDLLAELNRRCPPEDRAPLEAAPAALPLRPLRRAA